MKTTYIDLTPYDTLRIGDEAKRNAAVTWERISDGAAGTLAGNYRFWQFRRPVTTTPSPAPKATA